MDTHEKDMGEEERHRKKKADEEDAPRIIDLNDNDILSRSGRSQAEDKNRPGNVCFEKIIQEYSQSYKEAESREQKSAIVNNVLAELAKRNPTGRFVKKLPGERHALLLEESVLYKVARELRDAPSVEQRPQRKRRQEKPAVATLAPKRKSCRRVSAKRVFTERVVTGVDGEACAREMEMQQKQEEDIPGEDDECLGFMLDSTLLETEDNFLDTWIKILENSRGEAPSIMSEQLIPLLEKDSTLLAVHLPRNSVVRTVHLPQESGKQFAFKLSVPPMDSGDSIFLPTYLLTKEAVTTKLSTLPSSVNSDDGKENVPNRLFDLNRGDSVRDFSPFQKLLSVIPTQHSGTSKKESKGLFDDCDFSSQHPGRLLDHTHVLEERCNAILADDVGHEAEVSKPFETLLHVSSLCL